MGERRTCPWTGQEFEPVQRGAHEKKFASAAAKAEAHKAARLFAEHLIESGYMSWEWLHRWYDARQSGAPPSYTTRRTRAKGQDALPLPPLDEVAPAVNPAGAAE